MEQVVSSRKFLGNTKGKLSTFDKAHLKAYLKGKKVFNHGFTKVKNHLFPIAHAVKQELIYS